MLPFNDQAESNQPLRPPLAHVAPQIKKTVQLTAAPNINQSSIPKCVPIFILAINRIATDPNAINKKTMLAPMSQGCRSSLICACMYASWSGVGGFIMAVGAPVDS